MNSASTAFDSSLIIASYGLVLLLMAGSWPPLDIWVPICLAQDCLFNSSTWNSREWLDM